MKYFLCEVSCIIFISQMGMNPIGERGAEAVLKGVALNKTLKLVGLEVKYYTFTRQFNNKYLFLHLKKLC